MSNPTAKAAVLPEKPVVPIDAKVLRALPTITNAQFDQLVEVVRTLLLFVGVIQG